MPRPEAEYYQKKAEVFSLVANVSAHLKHFTPIDFSEGAYRDRFGNRVITSPIYAYEDREGEMVKAAALVSREGEELFRTHRKLLRPIEEAIIELETPKTEEYSEEGVVIFELGKNAKLERKFDLDGGQSNISFLHLPRKKIVIKKIQTVLTFNDFFINQPYFNEMLQVQSIKQDLGGELAELGFVLPTFLFATGQVCAVEFEEGPNPHPKKLDRTLPKALETIESYIEEQVYQGDPLWTNIMLDERARVRHDCVNFIERPDGNIALLDLVAYIPIEQIVMKSDGPIDFSNFF